MKMNKSEMRDFGHEFAQEFLDMEVSIQKITKISDNFLAGEPGLDCMSDVMALIEEYKAKRD